jgi:hypothetical protein
MASEFPSSPSAANLVAPSIMALSRLVMPNLVCSNVRIVLTMCGAVSWPSGVEPYHAARKDSKHRRGRLPSL